MANSKQAEKRARQNKARYKLRHSQRSQTRTAVKLSDMQLKKMMLQKPQAS